MTHQRREFPVSVRKAAWARCNGRCETCGREISARPGDPPHYDHRTPDALYGEPVIENCAVLCVECHVEKTRTEDVPRIAKSKRIEAERLGLRASKQRLPGGRGSKWKRRIDGTVIRREDA